ncbi:MAG: DNA (cytosine-5-)-methyltransferase [Candidatus Paceibacterota bacterium]
MDFTFADLFAGIGGFHKALHNHGGKCVFAAEKDKFARETYKTNYLNIAPTVFENNEELFIEDVTKIDGIVKIPHIDLIAAGFPCQPFSQAGLKKGFADTRGTLFHSIIELAKRKIKEGDPVEVLLLENVKGLAGHCGGETIRTIIKSIESIGYHFAIDPDDRYKSNPKKFKVLNAKNFGLPQNRERVFLVAYRNKDAQFTFPDGSKSPTKVGEILFDQLSEEDLETFTISNKLWSGHKRRKREHRQKGNGFGYSLFDRNSEYTSTISARYYKDGSEILIDQTDIGIENPRKLHPKEAAALQGFIKNKDWNSFKIPVSNTQAYKQFGNSVAVPVIDAIVNNIVGQILTSETNKLKKTA